MKFVHRRKMEEGIPVLVCEGVQGDRELLREEINRLGYVLRGNSQLDVDDLAKSQFKGSVEEAAGFLTEALLQGVYRFGKKALGVDTSKKLYELRDLLAIEPDVTVYLISSGEIEKAVEKAEALGRCRNYARMLGDLPANYLTADDLCLYAEKLAQEKPALSLKTYRNQELRKLGCGGILAVNQASSKEAALLHLRYEGRQKGPVTALVGKGVMFDSGGMHLKAMGDMEGMKYDMCGAADVLCLMEYAADTDYAFPLVGVIPLAENAVGENCIRMGDVISMLSGKTVEVYNTDAEGRLLLGDALSFAAGKADRLVDLATLTCSCREALGDETVGFFCNEESLADCARAAADECGEPVWRLPLGERYKRQLFWTKTADMANYMPDKKAGASVAGCFLEEFTNGLPWLHFDMVGPAVLRKENGRMECGATGTIFVSVVKLLEKHKEDGYGGEEERGSAQTGSICAGGGTGQRAERGKA